ncbi:MAG TPA: DnaB-like helicase C-terminal domain-containing protein, partial [bacterium]|nr:DnaB-like helicase C-terminal domain-containing protein [bacterium]
PVRSWFDFLSFMLNLAYNISGKGKAVGIISLEQDENELADRLISLASGINSLKIRKGELSQGDWSKIIEGAETIAKLPIYIIHLPGARIMEILIKMKQMKENHNCEVLFIDHLDEIDKQDSINNENITNIIENYVKKIRDHGIYLNAAVCALHQINRNVESRTDKRPKMADLRNCGALEQKADEGILLYRDKKYNPDNYEDDDVEIAEIIIGKNRNGPIRNIKLSFDEETIKFETYYV